MIYLPPYIGAIAKRKPDAYTVALLHMNGANGSTSFIDETGKVWTAVDNAQIDTAQYWAGGASGLFDGTLDRLTSPGSTDWELDGGSDSNPWTADLRVRFNGDPGTSVQGFFSCFTDINNFFYFALDNNALRFKIRSGGTTIVNTVASWNPAGNTWYHVALVKNGASGYMMFVNGTQVGSTDADNGTIVAPTGTMRIGRMTDETNTSYNFNGWLDEFRLSKGIARWTSNFTPPSTEY